MILKISKKSQNNTTASLSLSIILTLFCFSVFAQSDYHFVVKFTSKSGSSYFVGSPADYLSIKAIERRNKHNVLVTTEDLPIVESNIVALNSFKIEAKSKWFNLAVISSADSLLATQLSVNNFIDTIIYIGKKSGLNKKNTKNWDYGLASFQTNLVNGKFLHEKGYTGKGVLVGVVDVGFSNVDVLNDFDSLISNNRVVATYDFVENEIDVYDDPSHGTSVLSTISSFLDSTIFGTAPHANCLLLVSEDESQENLIEEFHYIEAIEFADSCGVDIINTSLGYTDFDTKVFSHSRDELTGDSTWITKATNVASRKGMLMVISAGNEGGSTWSNLTFPADADSVLSVGAVDRDGNLANFSSVGLPMNHNSIKPNIVAQGKQAYLVLDNGLHVTSSGTSFSSPQIAGWAACLMQAFPNETSWRIKKAIEFSAHQYNYPDSLMGYGIPDFEAAYYYLKHDGFQGEAADVLELFPNPTFGEITMVSNVEVDKIEVFDSKGALVFSQENFGHLSRFELSTFNNGYYTVRISTANGVSVQKIIKL